MGCGASHQPDQSIASSSFANAASSRAYWDRQKFSVEPWTAHSTLTVAKAAQANGMPEPPEIFFETQSRIIDFFQQHGKRLQFGPGDTLLDVGSPLTNLMIIEEGAVLAQKTINTLRKKEEPAQDVLAQLRPQSDSLAKKKRERKAYRQSRQMADFSADSRWSLLSGEEEEVVEEHAESPATQTPTPSHSPSRLSMASTTYEGEKVTISTLEKDELLGQNSFIEGAPLALRYVADTEGAAVLSVPTERFIQELDKDPTFAGNVFKNIAITLSVKCEEICWRLEEMAVEASSSWRASWRVHGEKHSQKYGISLKEARKLQHLLGVPPDEEVHHSTSAAINRQVSVHGQLIVFSESLCFYAKVFGMQVKKVLHVSSLISVLRDTPATKGLESAIEVASTDETIIFCNIPDLKETAEAIAEILQLETNRRRGGTTQVMEPNNKAREAAREALTTSSGPKTSLDQRFQLTADHWLEFLQKEAMSTMHSANDVIVAQGQQTDSLYQIARGCVRVEKTTHLGDGTVVISRLGPPAVFGEFFFMMGKATASLTSFVADRDGTELYVIKPESLQPYLDSKSLMPVCLHKYLATSMARKYRVLSATAGFGLMRTGENAVTVRVEEIFSNPVFLSLFNRFLRAEMPEQNEWLTCWKRIAEFRLRTRSEETNAAATELYETYLGPQSKLTASLSEESVQSIAEAIAPRTGDDGTPVLVRTEVFDPVQQQLFDALNTVSYDKFVSSSYFAGVQDLKMREKEVPGPNSFFYIMKLGTGSFGEVHAVRKKDTHKRYAMKLMSKQAQAEMSRRWMVYLRIEADVMAALNHPFLVNLNYCFQTPEMVFMVLDLVMGGDLNAFQQRFKTQPPTEQMLRFMSMQLISGLEFMHERKVLHRDMKPPNTLLDDEGNLRITDFGLSLKLKENELLYDRTGTKPYMAPELHCASKSHNRGYSYSVDWYALGVMIWEVMSGGTTLPPVVTKILGQLKNNKGLEESDFTDISAHHFNCPYMSHLSPKAQDFLASLLRMSPSKRLGDGDIKKHPFFEDANWAAVDARLVPPPWGAESLAELLSKRVDESVEERKTAEKAFGATLGNRMDYVSNFDFVSPRAVMEEYMENIYQLRANYEDHHEDEHDEHLNRRSHEEKKS